MQQFMTSLYNLITAWQPFIWIIAVIVLVGDGIMIMLPFQDVKDKGKRALPGVVIGVGIDMGAVVIAKEISGAFAF